VAVFISASDEHSGTDGQGLFLFAGYVGPEKDWSEFFVPAWRERVLDGPPKIPYLHMTEIRSKEFRDQWDLSRLGADNRVDEAAAVIDAMGSFYPIAIEVDGGHLKSVFRESRVRRAEARQFEAKPFEPDYLCFLTYAYGVLNYVHDVHPHVGKVHFVVEKKGCISRYIGEFHSNLDKALTAISRPELAPLVGELSTGDKADIPCQAADLLCWFAARFENAQKVNPEDFADALRYLKLRNRRGKWISLDNNVLSEMAAALLPKENRDLLSQGEQAISG
jgi:hypothetical protein